jgi:hypothetical protein
MSPSRRRLALSSPTRSESPDLNGLLAERATANPPPAVCPQGLAGAESPSPFKTGEDIQNCPDVDRILLPTKAALWKRLHPSLDLAQYPATSRRASIDDQPDESHGRTTDRTRPCTNPWNISQTLIPEGTSPRYTTNKGAHSEHVSGLGAVDHGALGIYRGWSSGGYPFCRPYSEAHHAQTGVCLRTSTRHRRPPHTTPALPAATPSTTARAGIK